MLVIILLLILTIAAIWSLSIYRAPSLAWLAALIMAVAGWQYGLAFAADSDISFFSSIVLWGITGTIAVCCFIPAIRQRWFTKPLLIWFKKVLPPISITERQAIESGDIWLETKLFQGAPDWQGLFRLPRPQLSQQEQQFIDNKVAQLCKLLDDWEITHEKLDLTPQTWQYLKEEGFFGLHLPIKYGGKGFSALANSTIVQMVASRSLTAAVTIMVPNSLGPGELLVNYGTEAQKNKYLPGLARGEEIPCFALTGVEAGSDAAAMHDTGIICKGNFAGKEILGIRLNWNKRYITLAPIATLLGLAFKLYDPDKLLGGKTELGITVCLVPTSLAGIDIGKRHLPLNQTFMNGPIRGKDVFVPLDYIVGGAAMIGQGWRMLVECLSAGRGISLPALSTSTGKLCFRMSGAYAAVRRQFGKAIGKFEGIEGALARIGGYTYMLEATRLLTLTGIDQRLRPTVVTAISKYHMTEIGRVVLNDAMDIHGGRGIVMGRRNYLARGYQGLPISITVEGANILTRGLIIFGQGAIRCHPYIRTEIELANQDLTKASIKAFDKTLLAHISYTISNFARWKWHTFTGFYLSKVGEPHRLAYYYRQLNKMSLALACIADITMLVLGGKLKIKEHLSARLGDVLSNLYMAAAVLKYYHDHGYQHDDLPFVQWCLTTCLHNMQTAMQKFLQNFPNRFLAWQLNLLLFPLGARYKQPLDILTHNIAKHMLRPSALRDRLTSHCWFENVAADPLGKLEHALAQLIKVEPLLAKLDAAVKDKVIVKTTDFAEKIKLALARNIISAVEADELTKYELARVDAISVDEFSAQELCSS